MTQTSQVKVRAGDSMPILGGVIRDQLGRAVDLTGAVAYLQVVTNGVVDERECTIADPSAGIVTYDWTSEETTGWGKGVHDVRVRVAWDNGDKMIAGGVELDIGPHIGPPPPPPPILVFTGIYAGTPSLQGTDLVYGGDPYRVGADTIYGGVP